MTKPEPFRHSRSYDVIRRCMHVISLLLGKSEKQKWNTNTLSDFISADEQKDVRPGAYKKYIKYITSDTGIKIDISQGAHSWEIDKDIDEKLTRQILDLYIDFIIKDLDRDMVLSVLMRKNPKKILWIIGGLYLSAKNKKKVKVHYYKDEFEEPVEYTLHPYSIVLKNTELYLLCRKEGYEKEETNHEFGDIRTFAIHKIHDIEMLDEQFNDEHVPSPEEYYEYSFGSYANYNQAAQLTLHVDRSKYHTFVNVFSNIEIEEKETENGYELKFWTRDLRSVCKQLFMYGNKVEIIAPTSARQYMAEMLRESMEVYG